jgi:ribosomal-protein-alanine N-acetyltransferase
VERMPYRPELDRPDVRFQPAVAQLPVAQTVSTDWRDRLPTLTGAGVTLRELRASDAPSLCALLTTEEASRFISPAPTTVAGFERFIAWTLRQRCYGTYACFAVTIDSTDMAIGIFQLRELESGFGLAEWGFALGSAYWGSGAFTKGAELLLTFAFDTVGVHRLEARATVRNGRGIGALRKIGAVQEGLLRKSLFKNGEYFDQALWTILDEDWRATRVWSGKERMILH